MRWQTSRALVFYDRDEDYWWDVEEEIRFTFLSDSRSLANLKINVKTVWKNSFRLNYPDIYNLSLLPFLHTNSGVEWLIGEFTMLTGCLMLPPPLHTHTNAHPIPLSSCKVVFHSVASIFYAPHSASAKTFTGLLIMIYWYVKCRLVDHSPKSRRKEIVAQDV